MFADDTSLFCEHRCHKCPVFDSEWFISNELSLNVKITTFSIFHKASSRDDLTLLIPSYINYDKLVWEAHTELTYER